MGMKLGETNVLDLQGLEVVVGATESECIQGEGCADDEIGE